MSSSSVRQAGDPAQRVPLGELHRADGGVVLGVGLVVAGPSVVGEPSESSQSSVVRSSSASRVKSGAFVIRASSVRSGPMTRASTRFAVTAREIACPGEPYPPGRVRLLGLTGAPGRREVDAGRALAAAYGAAGGADGRLPLRRRRARAARACCDRKGAPETFDAEGYAALLAGCGPAETVLAPAFEHGARAAARRRDRGPGRGGTGGDRGQLPAARRAALARRTRASSTWSGTCHRRRRARRAAGRAARRVRQVPRRGPRLGGPGRRANADLVEAAADRADLVLDLSAWSGSSARRDGRPAAVGCRPQQLRTRIICVSAVYAAYWRHGTRPDVRSTPSRAALDARPPTRTPTRRSRTCGRRPTGSPRSSTSRWPRRCSTGKVSLRSAGAAGRAHRERRTASAGPHPDPRRLRQRGRPGDRRRRRARQVRPRVRHTQAGAGPAPQHRCGSSHADPTTVTRAP